MVLGLCQYVPLAGLEAGVALGRRGLGPTWVVCPLAARCPALLLVFVLVRLHLVLTLVLVLPDLASWLRVLRARIPLNLPVY